MSNKLKNEIKTKEKKPNKLLISFKRFCLFSVFLIIGLFALYKYLNITEGFTLYFSKYDIQTEYSRFLIEINDDFLDKMVRFEDIVRNKESSEDYSKLEKEELSDIILAENSILSRLKTTAPKDKNLDYDDLYENISESYALYIQGQLMKMEYILQTDNGMEQERYTLGESVTNLMGNFIIEYDALANKVRNTSYSSKYGVLDGLEYNLGTAEQTEVKKDENGNIVIDDNTTYLYLPEDVDTVTEDSSADSSPNTNITNDEVSDYIDGFLNIQNK